jgi:hypothetical protein
MHVSAGAADLLTFLGEQLLILEQLVSTLLFSATIEKLGQGLDQLIITDVRKSMHIHCPMSMM